MTPCGLKFAGVVLLGPPASGKGTQGPRMAEWGNLRYFSTGKELRLEVERGTEFGIRTDHYLTQDMYVPDEPASVRKRNAVYEDLTLPVVEYYAESSRLIHVSGVGTVEEVFKRVLTGLDYDDDDDG